MKFYKTEVLNDVQMQFLVLCLLTALSVDSLKYVRSIARRCCSRGACGSKGGGGQELTGCYVVSAARSRP